MMLQAVAKLGDQQASEATTEHERQRTDQELAEEQQHDQRKILCE